MTNITLTRLRDFHTKFHIYK